MIHHRFFFVLFLSTPSVGRATAFLNGDLSTWMISIHALRGEGDSNTGDRSAAIVISIHALRGEGDYEHVGQVENRADFYPRPPWGGRQMSVNEAAVWIKFLSTPSVGRATTLADRGVNLPETISIHALRGEGDAPALKPP